MTVCIQKMWYKIKFLQMVAWLIDIAISDSMGGAQLQPFTPAPHPTPTPTLPPHSK